MPHPDGPGMIDSSSRVGFHRLMEALAEYGSSDSEDDECCNSKTTTAFRSRFTCADSDLPANKQVMISREQQERHTSRKPESRGYVSKRKRRSVCIETPSTSSDTQSDIKSTSDDIALSRYLQWEDGSSVTKRRRVFSVIPRRSERLLNKHSKPVVSLSWHNSNSTVLLSSSLDGTSKLWDTVRNKCIASLSLHSGAAISSGEWVSHNTVVTGGFDSHALLSDIEKGQVVTTFSHKDFVSVVRVHTIDKNLVFCGDFGANIFSWDVRTGKTVKQYKGGGGKILDMTFLQSGQELVASSDIVRKNASSHALRIWEVDSAVAVSNQVYPEPYTCPCLKAHPYKHEFYAQSNANYIVVFSTRRPYKYNKRKRYETHRVDGNKVQFDVSPDGKLLCSGSATGQVVVYDCDTSAVLKTLYVSNSACTAVAWNQHTVSTVAVSDWNSNISILK